MLSSPASKSLPTHCLHTLHHHQSSITSVSFTPNHHHAITASTDRSICLINPHKATNHAIHTYRGQHGYDITDVAVSSDSLLLASCGGDRTVFIWDVETGSVTRRLKGHQQRINTVHFISPSANNSAAALVISGSNDCCVHIYDLRSRGQQQPIQTLRDAKDGITSVRYTTDSFTIIAGSADGCIRHYDIRQAALAVDHLATPITALSLATDNTTLLASTLSSSIQMIDISSARVLQSFKSPHYMNSLYHLDNLYCSDERYVLSGTEVKSGTNTPRIVCWDVLSAAEVEVPAWRGSAAGNISSGTVIAMCWDEQQQCMLTGDTAGQVSVWAVPQ